MAIFSRSRRPAAKERMDRNTAPADDRWTEIEKLVIVTKKTPLEDLIQRLNSKAQAKFYLEQNQISFAEYEQSDSHYRRAIETIRRRLPRTLKHQFIDRDFLPTYQFSERDLIITVGPDGLVINTAKYLTTQPILAINPDPSRIDGILIPFALDDLEIWLERALRGAVQISRVSMAKATLNDGQILYAVNDLFVGARTHISARYMVEFGGEREPQSSSGIIISTGAGCTGWLRSIITGAWCITDYFGPSGPETPSQPAHALGWESEQLWFAVREPFISKTSQARLVFGRIEPGQQLMITSHMPDYGVIFSDGIEADYLAFNSGFIARVEVAERKAHLIRQ